MAITDIIAGAVLGIVVGGLTGFIIPLTLNKLRSKNSIKKIKKQKMTYRLNGEKYDFVADIDKSLKSNSKSEGVDLPKKGEGNNKDGSIVPSPSNNNSPTDLSRESSKTDKSEESKDTPEENSKLLLNNSSGNQNQTKLTELNQKV